MFLPKSWHVFANAGMLTISKKFLSDSAVSQHQYVIMKGRLSPPSVFQHRLIAFVPIANNTHVPLLKVHSVSRSD
jgi:hypothetical protein